MLDLLVKLTLSCKIIPDAQIYIDELAVALEQNQIKSGVIPWLKGVVKKGLFRTAAGYKKDED